MRRNCPVCLQDGVLVCAARVNARCSVFFVLVQDLFQSVFQVNILPCGHTIHQDRLPGILLLQGEMSTSVNLSVRHCKMELDTKMKRCKG